jgi:hypothetical protein
MPAQRHNYLRMNDRNLSIQISLTRLNLIDLRIAVAGRTTFYHIGDKHGLSVDVGLRQKFIEKLSGPAHKGNPLLIFMEAGGFSNEHNLGIQRPGAGNGVGPSLV